MPKVAVDVGEIVVNVSADESLLIKVTGGEHPSVILERKIREPLVVHLPTLMLSAGILWLIISLIVGNEEIRNTLHQRQ